MRVDFGTAEFLGFIGVMIPAVFVLAGFVIAGMAFRFKAEIDESKGTWEKEQALQRRSIRLVRQYLIFGGVLLAVFFVSSALEPSGVTWLIPASYAVVALAALLYFCRLLKKTYTFYFSITRMTARKHISAEVKVG
ncbi:hypothetical protein KAX17_05745 [Candidatus Bipolaricaulota bacterium]|nr:hypothetical protein [Candidatus Bipolaricaulota bacterium]